MESDFYTKGVSRANVLGGPARVIISKRSLTTYPEKISDVLDLTTYEPAANWHDVGHTSEPFEISDGFDTTDWISQQLGRINVQVGNWNRTISFTAMEMDNDWAMDLAHEAYGRTVNGDGDEVIYFRDQSNVTEWRVAALFKDEQGVAGKNIVMDVFPCCKRSGADSTTAWDRDNPQTATIEMVPFPDESVPNSANWYRIRQQ